MCRCIGCPCGRKAVSELRDRRGLLRTADGTGIGRNALCRLGRRSRYHTGIPGVLLRLCVIACQTGADVVAVILLGPRTIAVGRMTVCKEEKRLVLPCVTNLRCSVLICFQFALFPCLIVLIGRPLEDNTENRRLRQRCARYREGMSEDRVMRVLLVVWVRVNKPFRHIRIGKDIGQIRSVQTGQRNTPDRNLVQSRIKDVCQIYRRILRPVYGEPVDEVFIVQRRLRIICG